MDKQILNGLKFSLGIILGLSLFFGVVFAVGFHTANEVISGTFSGNYSFMNGNVGIGTSSPQSALDVNGSLKVKNISIDNLSLYVSDGGSIDSSVVLLIHSDETGTTFGDSSNSNHSLTANGDVVHSTTQKKFGSSSIYFDGNDYISFPDSTDFDFGTENFTIDMWVYPEWTGVTQTLIGQDVGSWVWLFQIGPSENLNIYSYDGAPLGGWYQPVGTVGTITANVWQHVAVVRIGSNTTFYVDGENAGTVIDADRVPPVSADMNIGKRTSGAGGGQYFKGYMDEVRVSKGIARWTGPFTPPSYFYYKNKIALSYDGQEIILN